MLEFKDAAGVLTSIGAVVAGFLGILRYFQYKTRRDKVLQVRDAFDTVVKSLSSELEVERLAGAILLRRFFDRETEVGIAGTPYWREAVNVTAAILRGQVTSNFQKLLADGLAYAPSLERADLTKTNLQYAYLGVRKVSEVEHVTTDLSYADFYRADLSGASLKKGNARGAVFYQCRMHNSVLAGADLRDAYFYEADLKGARFDGALLTGANFECARNIPPALANKLDKHGVYKDTEPFQPPRLTAGTAPARVFISKPGYLSYQQQQCVASMIARLEAEGMSPQTIERTDYPNFGVLSEVQRLMGDCAGAVIFGFKELEIKDGVWRAGTPDEKQIRGSCLSTPWNQIEAGMAVTLGLPMLVVCQRAVSGGVFDTRSGEHQVYKAFIEDGWNAATFTNSFAGWSADVRERGRVLA